MAVLPLLPFSLPPSLLNLQMTVLLLVVAIVILASFDSSAGGSLLILMLLPLTLLSQIVHNYCDGMHTPSSPPPSLPPSLSLQL